MGVIGPFFTVDLTEPIQETVEERPQPPTQEEIEKQRRQKKKKQNLVIGGGIAGSIFTFALAVFANG